MHIQQFVVAYEVEQDRLRSFLPAGFSSLRPVLRINGEVRDGTHGYLELNTPVEKDGGRGWLNVAHWDGVPFTQSGKTTAFDLPQLEIAFTAVGIEGSCPAEQDNGGCYFLGETEELRLPETVTARKEFCDCRFAWHFAAGSAHGVSIGKTLPAFPTPVRVVYPRADFTAETAAGFPCLQVLGTYTVRFER